MTIQFIDLGLRDFLEVDKIQKDFLEKRKNGLCGDIILYFQSYPVITLGRRAKESDILIDRETLKKENIRLYRINRGGGVTLHLPGQLIIYPILDLYHFRKDIGFYLRFLEEWIIKFLASYGIRAGTNGDLAGIWIEDRKICFIGIGISRWVSFHGLSLNVSPHLNLFYYINPCGIKGLKITSLKEELGFIPSDTEIKQNLKISFRDMLREKGLIYEIKPTSILVS